MKFGLDEFTTNAALMRATEDIKHPGDGGKYQNVFNSSNTVFQKRNHAS